MRRTTDWIVWFLYWRSWMVFFFYCRLDLLHSMQTLISWNSSCDRFTGSQIERNNKISREKKKKLWSVIDYEIEMLSTAPAFLWWFNILNDEHEHYLLYDLIENVCVTFVCLESSCFMLNGLNLAMLCWAIASLGRNENVRWLNVRWKVPTFSHYLWMGFCIWDMRKQQYWAPLIETFYSIAFSFFNDHTLRSTDSGKRVFLHFNRLFVRYDFVLVVGQWTS